MPPPPPHSFANGKGFVSVITIKLSKDNVNEIGNKLWVSLYSNNLEHLCK